MISTDLLQEFKPTLAIAIGQIQAVLDSVKESSDPEKQLLQLKAAQALLSKGTLMLLDDVYRKAIAEKISYAYQHCTGNCGEEALIERLRLLFPHIALEDVPQHLQQAQQVEQHLKEILMAKYLDTPPAII